MTATGHALLGTVIAAKIGNPYLALPIAFGSHILADLLPHWDAGTNSKKKSKFQLRREAALDVICGFVASYGLIYYVFPSTDLFYTFVVIIAAQGLDWLTAPYYMYGFKMQPFKFFSDISSATNTRLDKPWGIVTQATVVGLTIAAGLLVK